MLERFAKFIRKGDGLEDARIRGMSAELQPTLAQLDIQLNKRAIANISVLREEIIKESSNPERTRLYVNGLLQNALTIAVTEANPWKIKEELELDDWMMPPNNHG